MENGLFQSSAYGMLNPGVITGSQQLKWVHCLGKSVPMACFMSAFYSPESKHEKGRPGRSGF